MELLRTPRTGPEMPDGNVAEGVEGRGRGRPWFEPWQNVSARPLQPDGWRPTPWLPRSLARCWQLWQICQLWEQLCTASGRVTPGSFPRPPLAEHTEHLDPTLLGFETYDLHLERNLLLSACGRWWGERLLACRFSWFDEVRPSRGRQMLMSKFIRVTL